jgi:hypothetical protein
MNPITPMEAYATTDGQLHMDKLEAQAHQHGIDITPEVEAFLGNYRGFIDGVTRKHAIINWEVSKKLKELKGQNNG